MNTQIEIQTGKWVNCDWVVEHLSPLVSENRNKAILKHLNQRIRGVTILCENIYNPGNLGAIVRSAEFFGLTDCHTSGEILQKSSSRSAKSSNEWLLSKHYKSSKECIDEHRLKGYLVLGTHLSKESVAYQEIMTSQKILIVLGNEGDGVLDETLQYCDKNIVIPSFGMTRSLNLSVAASILLAHFSQNYRSKNNLIGDLSLLEKNYLMAYYLSQSIEPRVINGIVERYLK